ncbi:MAG: RecX family transcriptional regulator, partial [Ferruginibacter sp.]
VSAYCIKKALACIEEADYEKTLQKLANAKLLLLKNEKNIFVKKTKLKNYLLQKGFESNLLMGLIQQY